MPNLALHVLASWYSLAFLIAETTNSSCPIGYESVDAGDCLPCEPGIGCGYNATAGFPVGIYGPFTSTSQDLLACSVLFDIDIRKHFEPELQRRFGPPIVDLPVVHNNSRMNIQLGTSDSTIATGVSTTLNWFQGSGDALKIGALIGGLQDDVALPVTAIAEAFSVPQVAYGATGGTLSTRTAYPWIVRTKPSASLLGDAMWAWVTYFGVPGLVLAYTRDQYGRGLFQTVMRYVGAAGRVNQVHGVPIPFLVGADAPIEPLLAAADITKASAKRFIVLQATSEDANNFMYALEQREMLYGLYQILGGDGILWQSERTISASRGFPIGWQALQAVSEGPLYPRLLEMWRNLTAEDLYGEEARRRYMLDKMLVSPWEASAPMLTEADFAERSPFFFGAYLFDAAYTVFVALNSLLLQGLDGQEVYGQTLLNEIKQTTFEGVTGEVAYNANSDRYGNFYLVNQQPDGFVTAATWTAVSRSFLFPGATREVVWATGIFSEFIPGELIACNPGWQWEASLDACIACPVNWYSPGGVGNASACIACDAGEVSNGSSAAVSCLRCDPGTHRAIRDVSCLPCPEGTFGSTAGQSACVDCPLGTYSDRLGLVDCMHCGAGRKSQPLFTTMSNLTVNGKTEYFYLQGATRSDQCGCDRGLRSDANNECVECTEGLECAGMNDVKIKPGYYAPPGESLSIFSCQGKTDRCVGGLPEDHCASGRTGNLCGACLDGLRPGDGGTCVACGDSDNLPFVCAILLSLVILVMMYHFLDTQNRATQSHAFLLFTIALAQLVTVAQLLAVVSRLPLETVNPVKGLMDTFSFFTFDIEVLRLACVGSYAPLELYISKVFMIFLTMLLMTIIHCGFVVCRHKMAFGSRWHALIGAIGTLFMALYIAVTAVVLEPLQCVQHPNGRWTMRSEASVLCWEGDEHSKMLVLATFAWFCVPMAYLVACAYVVWQFPRRMQVGDARFLKAFTFLFFRFRASQHTYVLVQMFRSLFVALVLVIPDEVTQAFSLEIVLLLAYTAILYCLPWRVQEANLFDSLLCGGTLIIVCIVANFITDDQKSLSAISWCAVALIAATLSLIPVAIVLAGYKRWARASKPYKFFLCHHKAGAGAYARLLKLFLQEGQRATMGVFLDSDNLDDLDYLFEYVRSATETLVTLCSGSIFTRPWCIGEMCNAYLKRVRTFVVALPSCQLPDNEFIADIEHSVENLQVLMENGITIEILHKTLNWIRLQPRLDVPFNVSDSVIMAVTDHVLHGQANTEPIVSGKSGIAGTDVSVQCPAFYDIENLEAAAAAYVLKKMMIPLLINGHHDRIPRPIDDPEAALAKEPASTIIVLCTNGMFENRSFLMIAARMNLIMTQQTALLPLIAEQSFRFPPADLSMATSMQLQRLSMKSDGDIDDISATSASAIASWVHALFKQIGMSFFAQSASEAELRLSTAQITKRLLAKQLGKRGTGPQTPMPVEAIPVGSRTNSPPQSVLSALSAEEQQTLQQLLEDAAGGMGANEEPECQGPHGSLEKKHMEWQSLDV